MADAHNDLLAAMERLDENAVRRSLLRILALGPMVEKFAAARGQMTREMRRRTVWTRQQANAKLATPFVAQRPGRSHARAPRVKRTRARGRARAPTRLADGDPDLPDEPPLGPAWAAAYADGTLGVLHPGVPAGRAA
jgi:hypothetical protein